MTSRLPASILHEQGVRIHGTRPFAANTSTSFRRSWFSITSHSRLTTCVHACQQLLAVGRRRAPGPGGASNGRAAATKEMTASRNVLLGMVPVSTQTPPTCAALDQRHAPAELGGLHRATLPGRAAADGDEIEVVRRGVHAGSSAMV